MRITRSLKHLPPHVRGSQAAARCHSTVHFRRFSRTAGRPVPSSRPASAEDAPGERATAKSSPRAEHDKMSAELRKFNQSVNPSKKQKAAEQKSSASLPPLAPMDERFIAANKQTTGSRRDEAAAGCRESPARRRKHSAFQQSGHRAGQLIADGRFGNEGRSAGSGINAAWRCVRDARRQYATRRSRRRKCIIAVIHETAGAGGAVRSADIEQPARIWLWS